MLFFTLTPISRAAVITVPDQYPTIQAAINAAAAGDTIQVNRRPGETHSVYYERITINKQLTVIGESQDNITIDGQTAGTVVQIQADYVQFRGFTVRKGGLKYSGIRANSYSYLVIENNKVENNRYGIVLLNSLYNTIADNILINNSISGISLTDCLDSSVNGNSISESAYGIELSSSNATFVVGNTASNNSYGIYVENSHNNTVDGNNLLRNTVDGILPTSSYDITIKNNQISQSAYGIQLHQSNTITILRNMAIDNSYAVYLAYSGPSNKIVNNTLSQNDWGITLYGSSSNTIRGNTISQNTYGIDPATDSNSNVIYHNNFIDNVQQAAWNPYCVNTWDNGYPSGGNYWSDYTGTDSNGDGIGDTSYNIDPSNRDRYPLMERWGVVHDIAITNVTPSVTFAYLGDIVQISVTVKNEGTEIETFDVTAKYENTTEGIFGTIATQTVYSLNPSATTTLTFDWNTTEVQPCVYYTIKAEASVVEGETDTADNLKSDGTVKIKMVGDVNGDGVVDVVDLSLVAVAYGAFIGEPNYDPQVDLNKDGVIDVADISTVSIHFGDTC